MERFKTTPFPCKQCGGKGTIEVKREADERR